MRRIWLCCWLAGSLCLAAGGRTDFSGKWVFDKVEATQNPPSVLDSYTLAVNQGQREIKVDSKLDADLQPGRRSASGNSPADLPRGGGQRGGGRRGGNIGFPGSGGGLGLPGGRRGGIGGSRGGGVTGGHPPRQAQGGGGGGFSALATVVPSATYALDEKESSAHVGGRFAGKAKLKAKWKNDGKVLELSMVQKTADGKKITTHERWELEEAGKVLRVERSVEGARGKDKLKLAFQKA